MDLHITHAWIKIWFIVVSCFDDTSDRIAGYRIFIMCGCLNQSIICSDPNIIVWISILVLGSYVLYPNILFLIPGSSPVSQYVLDRFSGEFLN